MKDKRKAPVNNVVNTMDFNTVVRKSGHSGHIILPSNLIGKAVNIIVKVLD
jgi:putative transposon-encoded protein